MASLLQNESSKAAAAEAAKEEDVKKDGRKSLSVTDILSSAYDPHWQGGLCHAPDCNGTNAARDIVYCAFLPAHWTLAAQLCNMHNTKLSSTTIWTRGKTAHTWRHFCLLSVSTELHDGPGGLNKSPAFQNVLLVLINIQINLKNFPSLPNNCWCHCISEKWLCLSYSDFHLSPTWAQASSLACHELSKF